MKKKIIPSDKQLVHHCLLLPCVDGICWPNFFPFSALARLRGTVRGCSPLWPWLSEVSIKGHGSRWCNRAGSVWHCRDLVQPCASHDHYSVSCSIVLVAGCI